MKKTSYLSKSLVAVSAVIFFISFVNGKKNESYNSKITLDSALYINQVKQFIAFITTTEIEENTILLVDKPDMEEGCLRAIIENKSRFTTGEKEFIKTQISHPLINSWSTGLVERAVIINADTLTALIKDNFKNGLAPIKDMKKAYRFSAPVFFRNNTLCLFYSSYHCGRLCGVGQLVLYRKSRNTWTRVKEFCGWIS